MRSHMAYVFAATMALLCFDVFSDEGIRGNTVYYQIIDGDPESYEAFERSFFASESPILKLAKHSPLCSLVLQNPSSLIANLESIYKYDFFNIDNYSTSAARLIFEYTDYAA